MIFREDVQRLIHRPDTGKEILSVFLDMSVNSDNKRTYGVFLAQQRGRFAELDSDRDGHHRATVGAAFARIESWIANAFDESNKGAALYVELGGPWMEGLQLAVPLANRLVIARRPVVGPLAEVLETHPVYGVLAIDRESLRMLSVRSGQILAEETVAGTPLPAPNDVQAGGYSHKDFQKRKEQERRIVFKDFARQADDFDRKHHPDAFILVGTEDNVRHFNEFLSAHIRGRLVHTTAGPGEPRSSDLIQRLRPYFGHRRQEVQSRAVQLLQDRVRNRHFAASGVHETLEQLQEGKVDTLVIARDLRQDGGACAQCGFVLGRHDGRCPYCGGEVQDGVDLAEAMIRLAEEQDVPVEFVDAQSLREVDGAGALLRF